MKNVALIQELANQKDAYDVVAKQLEESRQQLIAYEAKINSIKDNYENQIEDLKRQQEVVVQRSREGKWILILIFNKVDSSVEEMAKQKLFEVVDQLVKQQVSPMLTPI